MGPGNSFPVLPLAGTRLGGLQVGAARGGGWASRDVNPDRPGAKTVGNDMTRPHGCNSKAGCGFAAQSRRALRKIVFYDHLFTRYNNREARRERTKRGVLSRSDFEIVAQPDIVDIGPAMDDSAMHRRSRMRSSAGSSMQRDLATNI